MGMRAGRQVWRMQTASLREDDLNQVRRDSLSLGRLPGLDTPS